MTQVTKTEYECSNCKDDNYVKDGDGTMYCMSCSAMPSDQHRRGPTDPWESFRRLQQHRREQGDRWRCVGGFEDAYWGEEEYEYLPSTGLTL